MSIFRSRPEGLAKQFFFLNITRMGHYRQDMSERLLGVLGIFLYAKIKSFSVHKKFACKVIVVERKEQNEGLLALSHSLNVTLLAVKYAVTS